MTAHTDHDIEFTFPYLIAGGEAATFECRCRVRVEWGHNPLRDGDVIDEICNPEVEVIRYEPFSSIGLAEKSIRRWETPDPALAQKIYDWLETQHPMLLDKARDDRAQGVVA